MEDPTQNQNQMEDDMDDNEMDRNELDEGEEEEALGGAGDDVIMPPDHNMQ